MQKFSLTINLKLSIIINVTLNTGGDELIQGKLKAAREAANMNYEQTASKVGLSTSGYWQIENGKRNTSYSVMVKLAALFNTTPDALFLQSELTKS